MLTLKLKKILFVKKTLAEYLNTHYHLTILGKVVLVLV